MEACENDEMTDSGREAGAANFPQAANLNFL